MNAYRSPARPWFELPPALADWAAASLADLEPPITAALINNVRAYRGAEQDDGGYGIEAVRLGVTQAVEQFVTSVRAGEVPRGRSLFFNLGLGHLRAGRDLPSLLASYALGARLVTRVVRERASADRLDPASVLLLDDAVAAYADHLAAQAATGWLYEHDRAPDMTTNRHRLLAMVLGFVPAPVETLHGTAKRCGWPLPERVRAIVAQAAAHPALVALAPPNSLIGFVDDRVCMVLDADAMIPSPEPGALHAAVGPAMPLADARRSYERASSALALGRSGIVRSEDVRAELLLVGTPDLREELLGLIAPLLAQPAGRRQHLLATLDSWLEQRGMLKAVAEQLAVHPQTVRLRLRKLEQLLGDALVAERSLDLHLAVRAAKMDGTEAPASTPPPVW